jgi:DNA-directed RNA polymerase specialized sigma24 family protein
MDAAALSEEELLFVEQIDLSEVPAQEVAAAAGVPVSKVHRVRTAALLKMKTAAEGLGIVATL